MPVTIQLPASNDRGAAMPAVTPLVVIESLRHAFPAPRGLAPHVALDGISAAIQPGIITGLVGPDAAGKTTLLRLIAGLLRPTEGRIIVFGHDMATRRRRGASDDRLHAAALRPV